MACAVCRSFGFILCADVLIATGAAWLPFVHQAPRSILTTIENFTWNEVFTNSNVDIVLAVLLRGLIFSCMYLWISQTNGIGSNSSSKWKKSLARIALSIFHNIFQLAVLVKTIVVAAYGDKLVHAKNDGHASALLIFSSCLVFCLFGELEKNRILNQPKGKNPNRSQTGDEATEPLLAPASIEEKSKKKFSNGEILRELGRMIVPDAHLLAFGLLAGLLAAVCYGLVPYFIGKAIDYAALDAHTAKFTEMLVALLVVALIGGVLVALRGGTFTYLSTKCENRMRLRLFKNLLEQEIGFYDATRTGDLLSRLQTDTTTMVNLIGLSVNIALRNLMQVVVLLFFMFPASWRLTVITVLLIPLCTYVTRIFSYHSANCKKKVQTEIAKSNVTAEEAMSSMTTVRAHAAEDSTRAKFQRDLDSYMHVAIQQALIYAGFIMFATIMPRLITTLVLFLGGERVLNRKMTPGSLVSFMLYQQSMADQISVLGDVLGSAAEAVGAAAKVVELMHRRPEVTPPKHLAPSTFCGKIELRNVVFRYPTRPAAPVLNGLSLQINPGQVVALVGPSGGGKSSIVKILERFYVPESGDVVIDGRDVGQYSHHFLKQKVAWVGQEPVLFARSIRDNVVYGALEEDGWTEIPSQEDIEGACKLANIHDFIMSLPDGYDTRCGEKGLSLSGGQKQRIAIARALVRKPVVLLLDEATSALDTESEAVVQEALDRCMKDHTVLVIAHRLSTIRRADLIVVIKEGRAVESGKHDELMKRGGIYWSLFQRQLQTPGA